MNRPNPPECYSAPNEGTTACGQEPTAEMPMSMLRAIRKALILSKANAVALLSDARVEVPDRGQRAVMDLYEKDIEELSRLVQWMERAYPYKDQGPMA